MTTTNSHILIFDVETTGLLPKAGSREPNPHIIQFSFILYNTSNRTIEQTHNYYINVAPEVIISPRITELTGITREMCSNYGISIVDALEHFSRCYELASTIVEHNHSFDSQMVKIEIARNIGSSLAYMFDPVCDYGRKAHLCTMKSSVNICNIMVVRDGQAPYKKWPTLLELYRHLFSSTPDNLHNALVDVLVCLRCFLMIYMDIHIDEPDFARMIVERCIAERCIC